VVLPDWTADVNITVSSPTGSPTSDPALKEVATGNVANTRETYFLTPTGNNVNGIAVNNIQQGQIETWFYEAVSAPQAAQNRTAAVLACRYTDTSNYYNVRIWKDHNTGGTSSGWIIEKRKAAADTVIASGSLSTNITAATYYKMRFTWWVVSGLAYFRLELSTDGGNTWVQQGNDVADSENFNTGSTVKIGVGCEIGLNNSTSKDCDIRFDGTIVKST
jgi:hypothetical protein